MRMPQPMGLLYDLRFAGTEVFLLYVKADFLCVMYKAAWRTGT